MVKKTLIGKEKNGDYKQWSVWTEGDTIFVEHGKLGGKMQVKTTVCAPKNVGRSNETTASEQAESEAQSKWNKQHDKYYRETIEEVEALQTEGVMLAQDYTKKPHYLNDAYFFVSPKLDGLRVKTVFDAEGNPSWESRGGKQYPVPGHIVKDLQKLYHSRGPFKHLDGEAYIHGEKLQNIQSAVKKPKALTDRVEYHIFDIPHETYGWEDRLVLLLNPLQEEVLQLDSLEIVEQVRCENKAELPKLLGEYLARGYEGIMLRNPDGPYLFQNKRSNDLLKYKEFHDSEAKVIDCRRDKNQEGVLLCDWKGVEFELKMKGTHEYRLYENQKKLIGKWVNFKYQDVTQDGVPTFAVGTGERNCDHKGDPLE